MKTSPRPRTSWRDLRPFLHSVLLENFSTPDRSQCPSQPWGVFALPNSVVKPSSAVGTIRIDPGKWERGKNTVTSHLYYCPREGIFTNPIYWNSGLFVLGFGEPSGRRYLVQNLQCVDRQAFGDRCKFLASADRCFRAELLRE